MPDSGPCNTWVVQDLSTIINGATIFGAGSAGSVATYSSGSLHATTLGAGGFWYFAFPDFALSPDKQVKIEFTFAAPLDTATGVDTFALYSLGSTDPAVESGITDDFNELGDSVDTAEGVDGLTVYTSTIGPGTFVSGPATFLQDNFNADVVGKGYSSLLFRFVGFSTAITQIRTMLLCSTPLLPGVRRHGIRPLRQYPRNDGLAGSVPRLWPPAPSIQASNRRGGAYL